MLVLSKVKAREKRDKKGGVEENKTIKNAEKGGGRKERVDKKGRVW